MEALQGLTSLMIDGYRPFRDFQAELGRLVTIVGVNGSGKSSLLEFLRVLRDGMEDELPAGLVAGGSSRQVYHLSRVERIRWQIHVAMDDVENLIYRGALAGRYGNVVLGELVTTNLSDSILLSMGEGGGLIGINPEQPQRISLSSDKQLAVGTITNPEHEPLLSLQRYMRGWRFYSSFGIASDAIRQPVITEQDPVLREDASNLSDVLHYLRSEHEPAFNELRELLRLLVPGFKGLKVKSYGAPGQVMAFWQEDGLDGELTLADLSDGIFRLLCWTVLCVVPNPPTLVCIDEPDQGIHPRALPILAGMFKKLSERTQVILATHNSYFLSQFDMEEIAVMRKEEGRAVFRKPKDSKALSAMLEDFGHDELEALHRSEELERLS